MSDEPIALPPPEPEPPPPPPFQPPRAAPRRQSNLVPWVYALGFVVLAFALIWIWQNPNPSPEALRPQQISALVEQVTNLTVRVEKLEAAQSATPTDVKSLQAQIAELTRRVTDLPKPAAAPDLAPVEQQIAALKTQMANAPHAAAPDLTPIERQVAAIQQQVQHFAPDNLQPIQEQLAGLDKQVSSLGQLPAQLDAASHQQAALNQRLENLAAAQQDLANRVSDLAKTVSSQASSFDQKVAVVQQQAAQVSAAAAAASRLARIEAARSALASGEKLGAIDRAPPALARFADTAPPTEAELRLSFPQAAKAALAATGQQDNGATFGQRVLSRAQSLITVREGDRVLIGDPSAGLIASAQTQLDAGDLRGAVASLSKLTGPPAQAISPWLDKAKALLAARDALNTMAAHA